MKRRNSSMWSENQEDQLADTQRLVLNFLTCVLLLVSLITAGVVHAQQLLPQSSNPAILGSTGGLHPPTQALLFNGSTGAKQHLRPGGKPCVTVTGEAKPQTINPHIFTHTVMAVNECGFPIKLTACYFQTEECSPLTVPPYGRNQAVLGIMPAMDRFRFEFREKFDGFNGMGALR